MFTKELLGSKIASFSLNGVEYPLIPDEMEQTDGVFYTYYGSLRVSVLPSIRDDSMSWTVYFENTGSENSGRISLVRGLDLTLPLSPADGFIWRGLNGDSCDGNSFLPQEKGLAPGMSFTIEPAGGRSSNTSAFPFFNFTCAERVIAAAIGWSGQWYCDFVRDGDCVRITAGQRDCDFYLLPGESARSVSALLYSNGGDADDTRRGFRALLRRCYSPAAYLGETFEPPLSVQCFDRYFWTNPDFRTEQGQLKLIDGSSGCGFDTFWLDAAWFREGFPHGVGNYSFAPGFEKNGLKSVSDAAHAAGMKFMVWFEPERIDIGSDIFAAHGDGDGWLLSFTEGDTNRLFNLGNPDALKWMTDNLIRFIGANGIDIYREDFNIDPLPYWRAADTEGRRGLTEMKFVRGLYKMWDAIIAAYPSIMIDNCSSGGRRIDLETVSRSIPCWQSDTACSPDSDERPISTWTQNQHVSLSRCLPYHLASTWFEKAYHFRSGMTDGLACAFDFLGDSYDKAPARRAVDELHRLRRYWKGDFIQITPPSLSEDIWFAYQLTCEKSGCALAFRRRACAEEDYTLALAGLDADRLYSLYICDEDYNVDEAVCSGEELMQGITLHSDSPMSSFTVEYRRMT